MTSDRSDGYSLLELLVVMAIMALITASVVPMLPKPNELVGTDDLARRFEYIFSSARAKALTSKKAVTVRVIFSPDVSATVDDVAVLQGVPRTLKIAAVSARVRSVKTTEAVFKFLPEGGSTGGSITISDNSDQQSIALDWLTGTWTRTMGPQK